MSAQFGTVLCDPPWEQHVIGRRATRPMTSTRLPYPTLSVREITALPIAPLLVRGAHVWLWTTNQFLRAAFDVLEAWGVRYLTTVTWVKPSGCGAWFASTTQHCLMGYYGACRFPLRRYAPTHFHAAPKRHSAKPEGFYDLIESISPAPRLELFARQTRLGWSSVGDGIDGRSIEEVLHAPASIVR